MRGSPCAPPPRPPPHSSSTDAARSPSTGSRTRTCGRARSTTCAPVTPTTCWSTDPSGPRHDFDATRPLLDPYARGIDRGTASRWTGVVVDDAFDWGGLDQARRAARPGRRLRGERPHPDEREPRRAGAPARHVRGCGAREHHPAPAAPRCDDDRAAAGARVRLRALVARGRARERVGLQHARVLRAARGVRLGARAAGRRAGGAPRVQGHGPAAARGRHPGGPRRRLQPHRRRGPGWTDVVAARDRRCEPVPLGTRRHLLRHDGLRQHARHLRRRRRRPGPRQPAVLGARGAGRRVPVRPDGVAGPRRRPRLRPRAPGARADPHRPGPAGRAGHRRAVGRRPGRLAYRALRRADHRVERRLPQHGAAVLADGHRPGAPDGRPGCRHRRARRCADGVASPVRRRPRPAVRGELRHGTRRVHAARPDRLRPEAQRGERRRGPRRLRRQPLVQPRRRGRDRGPRRPCRPGPFDAEPARHAVPVGGRADAHRRRRAQPHPARQQQRVRGHRGPDPGRLVRRRGRRVHDRDRRCAHPTARGAPGAPTRPVRRRRADHPGRLADALVRARRRPDDRRVVGPAHPPRGAVVRRVHTARGRAGRPRPGRRARQRSHAGPDTASAGRRHRRTGSRGRARSTATTSGCGPPAPSSPRTAPASTSSRSSDVPVHPARSCPQLRVPGNTEAPSG